MAESNPNARIEAFSDGVFAIALTLLIIDIKIPSVAVIHSTSDLWNALQATAPSVFAFILSFVVIFITWVNHHNNFKSLRSFSIASIYANAFLLLTVVVMPYPTALLGNYILTPYAAPAVVLYNAVLALQALGWVLLGRASIAGNLVSENLLNTVRKNTGYGYYGFVLYTLFSVLAFWFPVTIAVLTTITWIFWIFVGINTKQS